MSDLRIGSIGAFLGNAACTLLLTAGHIDPIEYRETVITVMLLMFFSAIAFFGGRSK